MLFRPRLQASVVFALVLALACVCGPVARAQTGNEGDDPVKLFTQGQDAHARGDLATALDFYDRAIKLHPEFPEAEYQRGSALFILRRYAEAEKAFRRAIELREDWAMPHAALGALLAQVNRYDEAERSLRRALELEPKNRSALMTLANVRIHAGAFAEAVAITRQLTAEPDAPSSAWALRGLAEFKAGDRSAAALSLDHALRLNGLEVAALTTRAELREAAGDYAQAAEDLRIAQIAIGHDDQLSLKRARLLALAGNTQEALRELDALGPLPPTGENAALARQVEALRSEIRNGSNRSAEPTDEEAATLEQQLAREPNNAKLLARLGGYYRTRDPERALQYFRRASDLEPRNADYATGYAAALVQAKRFDEAATILRRVIGFDPENYAAHANLAIALYELKRFPESIEEYRWLLKSKPNLAVAHYFIATALDRMGQFQDALAEYEAFLSQADAQENRLEVEKVNLRLPALKRQIREGQGAKKKRSS